MFYLILQTALLILAAFVFGAICGCLFHRMFGQGGVLAAGDASATAPTAPIPTKPKRKTPAESAAAAATATVMAKTAAIVETEPTPPSVTEPVELAAAPVETTIAPVEEMDDAAAEAAIAALPADATNEDKANAVGVRPSGLDAPIGDTKDNLQRIKGIGKVNEGKLNDLGIYHFSQIKEWTPSEARWVGTFLSFSGRIEREDWIGQAGVLADGGETDFAKRVDKGQVSSSSNKRKT